MVKYVLSDNHGRFLRRDNKGNYTPVKNIGLADMWERRSKAANVLNSCVNKNLRKRYQIVEILQNVCSENECLSKFDIDVKSKNSIVKTIANEPIEENNYDVLVTNIENLSQFVKDAEERKIYLNKALSNVDKEISDINHYIEFGKFNAYQGWLAFDMLKQRLTKRRNIKNELQILTQIGDCNINTAMFDEIKSAIENVNSKVYQPRVLKELFD